MNCSVPFISEDGKMTLSTPCVGFFEPDFSECCYYHDIDLWCTSGAFVAALLGIELIDCFKKKITEAYTFKAPFLCEIIELPILLLVLIVVPTILSPLIGVVASGNDEYRNIDGKNSDSCLCGGDIPTLCCEGSGYNGVCRDKCCNEIDLCSNKFDSKRGQGCTKKPKCSKICAYSVHPKYYYPENENIVPTYQLTSKSSFFLGNDNSKTVAESECYSTNLPGKCTDECFNCFYACKRDSKTGKYYWKNGKILVDASFLGSQWHHLPCCEGTPNENENDRSNICPTDRNGGVGSSLPICGSFLHIKNGGGPCIEENRGNSKSKNLVFSSQEVI